MEDEKLLTKKLFGETFNSPHLSDEEKNVGLRPVWEDDDNVEESQDSIKDYQTRRKRKHQKSILIGNTPSWAAVKKTVHESPADSEEEDIMDALNEMTKSTNKYLTKSRFLPKTHLNFTKLKDVTLGYYGRGNIKVAKFHPHRPVLMTASYYGKLAFMDDITVKSDENFLQEVTFNKYIISSAGYYNNGNSIFVGSTRYPYFFSYDLIDGKVLQIPTPKALPNYNYGRFTISHNGEMIAFIGSSAHVYICALKTMEHVHTFCAAANIADVQFSPINDHLIYASADNGTIYMWNLAMKEQQYTFVDEGCIHPTCLTISPNEQFLSAGSNTGIINIYDLNKTRQSQTPTPLYTITNLTTATSFLKYNHDSQTLAFGSMDKKMQARMLHIRSGTVFQNFPAKQEMFEHDRMTCTDFSPNSGFVVFGTESGSVRMYRLNYFDKY